MSWQRPAVPSAASSHGWAWDRGGHSPSTELLQDPRVPGTFKGAGALTNACYGAVNPNPTPVPTQNLQLQAGVSECMRKQAGMEKSIPKSLFQGDFSVLRSKELLPKEEAAVGLLLTQHVDLGASQEGCGSVSGCGHGRQRHPDVLEHVIVLQVVVRPQVRSHPTSRIDSIVWTRPRSKKISPTKLL